MASSIFNGIRFSTIITVLIILGGGLVAWGESRYRIADNSDDIESIEEEQEELDSKVDTVIGQQIRMDEQLKTIIKAQKRQERLSEGILDELRRRRLPDPN